MTDRRIIRFMLIATDAFVSPGTTQEPKTIPERTIVTIEADHLARTDFTPDEFDFLLDCAEVGLEGATGAHRGNALVQRLRG